MATLNVSLPEQLRSWITDQVQMIIYVILFLNFRGRVA